MERSITAMEPIPRKNSVEIRFNDMLFCRWTMPDEYKTWLEKMEAFEKRKAEQLSTAASDAKPKSDLLPKPPKQAIKPQQVSNEVPVYENPAEAVAAFKELLEEREVSLTSKLKEAQDRCSDDPRWNALRTTGEKKQALAEYQTWRLKQEKEEARARARRHKESFYVMLAEATEIDAKSKFRDCVSLLSEDPRFKAVEDNRLREDYFRDFVEELDKKQRQEAEAQRAEALKDFEALLRLLSEEEKITRKSIWANAKDEVSELATAISDVKFKPLDVTTMRRCFQSIVDDLEAKFKETERARREELKRQARTAQQKFIVEGLEPLVKSGEIRVDSKWRAVASDNITKWQDCKAYTTLLDISTQLENKKSEDEPVSCLNSSLFRECFDDAILTVKDRFREDRRHVRSALDAARFKIRADSTLEDMELKLKELAGADAALDGLLSHRPWQLKAIFLDLYEPIIKEKRAAIEKQKKREDRFISLLEEYYFRSDHVDVTWEQAKRTLERHSAYDSLERGDRRRLFDAHMNTLKSKLAEKKMAMASLQGISVDGAEEGEVLDIPEISPPAADKPRNTTTTFERAVGRGRELTLPSWMVSDAAKSTVSLSLEASKTEKFADSSINNIDRKNSSEQKQSTAQALLTTAEENNGVYPEETSSTTTEKNIPQPKDTDADVTSSGGKREREATGGEAPGQNADVKPTKRAKRSSRRK